ncbi:MAG: branched-chain amino acid ABC transporter permease [Chloroflexota bacterium]|nr:branched-chain amino acid ABC transporter permease [Chloroflexota bacterium]
MSVTVARSQQNTSLIILSFLLILVLLPYGFAVVTGTADAEMSGLAAMQSAAESVYCVAGLTPVTIILLAELGLLAALVVGAQVAGTRLGAVGAALREHGWLLLGVMLLITVPFIIGWHTETSICTRGRAFFWESIFIDVYILAILAISYNLLFGFSGIVSFGHAAFFGMGAYTVGLLMLHLEWPWWLATGAALLVGVLIALIKGGVGLRIRGLYFALFTLAFAEILFLLAGNRIMVNITGAEDGFTFQVPDFLNITQNRVFFYYMTLAALVISYLLVRRLMNSPTGRVLYAIRDNEERAQMLGYNTFHFKLIAIVTAGILASGAGVLRGFALKGASPNVLGLDFTMTPLLMTIIGGQGTFFGPVVGAFLLRLLEQMLRDTVITLGTLEINIGERWALILGLVFVVIVIIFPYGIVGTLKSRWHKWRAAQKAPMGQSEPLGEPERLAEGG